MLCVKFLATEVGNLLSSWQLCGWGGGGGTVDTFEYMPSPLTDVESETVRVN